MENFKIKPPPPRSALSRSPEWISTVEKMTFAALISMLCLILLIVALGSIRADALNDEVLQNREENIKNRAVDCHILAALGQELDPYGPCFDKPTLAYWDPNGVTPPSTASTRMICSIAVVTKIDPKDLSPACAEYGLGPDRKKAGGS